jgi:antitoxin ParD1/3/4
MTVKISIELDDSQRAFAERMVENGTYPSISSVVQAGIDRMMQNDEPSGDPLAGWEDEIRRRMATPREQFISMKDDDLFDRLRARLAARKQQQR